MQVVLFLVHQRDQLVCHNLTIAFHHAIFSEDVESVRGKGDRHIILIIFDHEESLELLQVLLQFIFHNFEGPSVVIPCGFRVDKACGARCLPKLLLRFVLQVEMLPGPNQ